MISLDCVKGKLIGLYFSLNTLKLQGIHLILIDKIHYKIINLIEDKIKIFRLHIVYKHTGNLKHNLRHL